MNDKYTESDIHFRGKFAEKLDNFWFYYKWHTIIGLFLALVLTVCIVQSCTKTEYDVKVLYAGPYAFPVGEVDTFATDLNKVMPEDFNGDGEKLTGLVNYNVLTEAQMTELQEQLRENEGGMLDTSYYTTQAQQYRMANMSGDFGILLLDPALYEDLAADGRLKKLSDVFPTAPENAVGDYGIRFSETQLYKNAKYLNRLPQDTVMCLFINVLGDTGDPAKYAQMTEMFIAMARTEP